MRGIQGGCSSIGWKVGMIVRVTIGMMIGMAIDIMMVR
jgi:hypothetical protein